jgi:serine/threonine protein kinase
LKLENGLRYTPPENIENINTSPINNIWMLGCLFIELFSTNRVWEGFTNDEIIKNLKSQIIPKIPNDFPQQCWGIVCECLNPYFQARSDIKEILSRFYSLMGKMLYTDLQTKIKGKTIFIQIYHY